MVQGGYGRSIGNDDPLPEAEETHLMETIAQALLLQPNTALEISSLEICHAALILPVVEALKDTITVFVHSCMAFGRSHRRSQH